MTQKYCQSTLLSSLPLKKNKICLLSFLSNLILNTVHFDARTIGKYEMKGNCFKKMFERLLSLIWLEAVQFTKAIIEGIFIAFDHSSFCFILVAYLDSKI
ncbi:hypothetical protein BD560DRAFT_395516, partial [Blakeslea trispora]